jgi:hypothetical protein
MGFWEWIKSLFKKPENPPPEPPPPAPKPMPAPPIVEEEIDWKEWTKKAAYISSTYEGKGGDYANITGNFDGAFLTCGLLGLTWKYGNIVRIMDKYLKKYGPNKLLKLMPKTGQEYLEAINAGVRDGAGIVSQWSNGPKVNEPYKSELTAFWSSPEMVELQDETYTQMMGLFAKKMANETAKYFELNKPLFEHYAYWWDQAVLNGTSKVIPFKDAKDFSALKVIEFSKNVRGYNSDSMKKNATLWKEQMEKASLEQLHLFKMAYLRALESRPEFQGTTLMRRGTIALGIGYVNGTLRKYEWS